MHVKSPVKKLMSINFPCCFLCTIETMKKQTKRNWLMTTTNSCYFSLIHSEITFWIKMEKEKNPIPVHAQCCSADKNTTKSKYERWKIRIMKIAKKGKLSFSKKWKCFCLVLLFPFCVFFHGSLSLVVSGEIRRASKMSIEKFLSQTNQRTSLGTALLFYVIMWIEIMII